MLQTAIEVDHSNHEIFNQQKFGVMSADLFFKVHSMNGTGASLVEIDHAIDQMSLDDIRSSKGTKLLDKHCILLAQLYHQTADLSETLIKAERKLCKLPHTMEGVTKCDYACFAFDVQNAKEDLAVWKEYLYSDDDEADLSGS